PNLAEAILGLGMCQLHMDHPEEALSSFDECLKTKPNYDNALYGKAVALQLLGQRDEAFDIYVKLLATHAANVELLTNLIGLSIERGEDAKVREYSEKLLRVRPGARAALEGLTAAAIARGDFKTAAQHGAQLVKAAGKSYEAWFNLGLAYQKTNRME